MRFLNKIVFINSAHIPYAEVKLDGNVHFIGTQGVGKSTLLRAILFFYNADKNKLGIRTQDKQRSYDEFYFPYPNSYIIYELCRDNGKIFVMSFISSGRVAFRIVDCAYRKEYFLEDDGTARYEWGRISEQIGPRIFKSNIIRSYEEFRDIIYGNSANVTSKELRRFSLMESPKYQNIPRTIQNIFLNQSLESRVIKDTVIDSMDFASDSIDLNFYREHVKDFRQQYEDVLKWYRQDKNGKIKVRSDADNVLETYALREQARRNTGQLASMLNHAVERDKQRLPGLDADITLKTDELEREKRLLSEEESKYSKELGKLNEKEGELKAFFKQLKEKQAHYEEIGIEGIAARVSKKAGLDIRKTALQQQMDAITDKNRSVTEKYEALARNEDSLLEQSRNEKDRRCIELDRQLNDAMSDIKDKLSKKLEALESAFRQSDTALQEELDEQKDVKNGLQLRRNAVAQQNPFASEMKDLASRIDSDERRIRELELMRVKNGSESEKIKSDFDIECGKLQGVCDKDIAGIGFQKEKVKEEFERIRQLLDSRKGSLVEWLEGNVQGWQQDIGKVVSDDILYSTALSPQKTGGRESLYGVGLDLENVVFSAKTPEQLRRQLEEQESRIAELDGQAAARRQKLDDDREALRKKPQARLKALRLELVQLDAELASLPAGIEKNRKILSETESRLAQWRKSETDAFDVQIAQVLAGIEDIRRRKQLYSDKHAQEVSAMRKDAQAKEKRARADTCRLKEEQENDFKHRQAEAEKKKRELVVMMDAELKGLGVDVARLDSLRREHEQVTGELQFIESNQHFLIEWQKDKREYFDLEHDRKEEQHQNLRKIHELKEKFAMRKNRHESRIQGISEELNSLQGERDSLMVSLDKAESYLANSTCPQFVHDAVPKENARRLSDILEDLKDSIMAQEREMEQFRKAVNAFKTNFSARNTFNFRTEFNHEEDYTEFASELNEFIVNDKIELYRERISSQYATIIQRIAREVGDLNQHNAEIRRTINEINQDFRDNNFAGVIKEIELRAVESSDRMMQELLNIKKFDEESGFELGNLNLFSSEESMAKTNRKAVGLLMSFIDRLDAEPKREQVTLSDSFKLEFKVRENDNDTNWVEKLSNVGSDGTDVLVKSMVNIMLINVFKRKNSKRFGDFCLHCMMDEIGKLHPDNVEGILKFANVRNIFLINSSPTTYNAQVYKYTYSLSKDEENNTVVKTLLTIR